MGKPCLPVLKIASERGRAAPATPETKLNLGLKSNPRMRNTHSTGSSAGPAASGQEALRFAQLITPIVAGAEEQQGPGGTETQWVRAASG